MICGVFVYQGFLLGRIYLFYFFFMQSATQIFAEEDLPLNNNKKNILSCTKRD